MADITHETKQKETKPDERCIQINNEIKNNTKKAQNETRITATYNPTKKNNNTKVRVTLEKKKETAKETKKERKKENKQEGTNKVTKKRNLRKTKTNKNRNTESKGRKQHENEKISNL